MNILLIHQNFPGQFRHLAWRLQQDGLHKVLAIGKEGCPGLPGVDVLTYRTHRPVAKETHHYVRGFESGVIHGQAVMRLLLQLRSRGFIPDVVVAHPGWGETLFVKDIFPACKLVHLCEYYYHSVGVDLDFDPEFPATLDDRARIRARNALQLLNLEHSDVAIAPTQWQKSLFPKAYQAKIKVVHEGIKVEDLGPDPQACFKLPNGRVLKAGEPVVTYVSRNLEPYRGFHCFVRALPSLLERHPQCEVVIVGGDDVSYGRRPEGAPNWREKMLKEVRLDPARVHFTGAIAYAEYCKLLQVSAAHVYLTYPFVLSWSMLEAMASGCLVIGSRTPPVEEVLIDGFNGLLVDFFDGTQIVDTILHALEQPAESQSLRQRARETVRERYGLEGAMSSYLAEITAGDGLASPAGTKLRTTA